MIVAIDAVGIRDGGGAAILEELLQWLPRARPTWQWDVFLLDRSMRRFDDPNVGPTVTLTSTRQGNTGLGRIRWAEKYLPKRLEQVGANVLFAFANTAPARPRIPQVVYCHQPLILFSEARAGYPLKTRARLRVLQHIVWRGLRTAHFVVVQTGSMREQVLASDPRMADRVVVIPSGNRTAKQVPIVRPEVTAALTEGSGPRLLYVSYLRYHKNHPTLLRAMAEVVRSLPAARLLLTADPNAALTSDIGPRFEDVKQLVTELKLEDHIVWLGQLSPDEVFAAMQKCDLMVFPSLAESFGLPLVEAMAAGCPIAAADLPYAHDVAGPAAAYFDPRDPAGIAACILRLLAEPAEMNALRREAEARRGNFSYDTIAESLASLFERAAQEPAPRGRK